MRILTVLVVLAAALAALFLLRDVIDRAPEERASEHRPDRREEAIRIGPSERTEPPETPSAERDRSAGGTFEAAASVRGIVVDGQDRPIAGADVRLDALDPSTLRGAPVRRAETLATSRSDRDGGFALPLDARRWVRVVASAPRHGTVGARVPGPGAFVRLVLPPGGTVLVEVADGDGRGVAEADVTLVAGATPLIATTDERGSVRFENVPAGAVRTEATAAGLREGRAPPVTCVPGEVTRVVVLLPHSVRLAGTIVERGTGRPVPGAEVHLGRPGRAIVAGPTRGDGTFGPVAAGVPGAAVMVAVRADGYAPALVPVQVPDTEEIHQVEVALERAVAWAGRVVDGAGKAIRGARVGYTAAGIAGRIPRATRTDEEGRFHLPPPSPPAPGRRVVLVAEHGGRLAARALRPGDEAPADLVLVLARAAVVTGRVTDAEGAPRSGLVVRLDPRWRDLRGRDDAHTSRLRASNERGRLDLMAATDAGGGWRLVDVPDGTYDLQLATPGGATRHAITFTVSGADVDLGVLRSGTGHALAGRVIDASALGLTGVEIVARDAQGRRARTRSAEDGSWRLEDLAAGAWTITATLPGLLPASVASDVPTTEAIEHVLGAGARIAGRVLDRGQAFSRPFTLHLESEGFRRRRRVRRAFVGGRFDVVGLEEGAWRVRVETARGRGAELPAPVEVRPGATFEVELELAASARVSGRVTTPTGAPAADARVTLTHEASGRRRKAAVGKGTWAADGLPAGAWRVVARGAGGAPVETTVDLVAGAATDLDLVLGAIGRLEVTVAGADGKIRRGAYVTVRAPDGPSPGWRRPPKTDDDGVARIAEAPTGLLDVLARTADGEVGRTQVTVAEGEVAKIAVTVLGP